MRLHGSNLPLRHWCLVELAAAEGSQGRVRLQPSEDHGQSGFSDDNPIGRPTDEPEPPGECALDRRIAELGVQCNPECVRRSGARQGLGALLLRRVAAGQCESGERAD